METCASRRPQGGEHHSPGTNPREPLARVMLLQSSPPTTTGTSRRTAGGDEIVHTRGVLRRDFGQILAVR